MTIYVPEEFDGLLFVLFRTSFYKYQNIQPDYYSSSEEFERKRREAWDYGTGVLELWRMFPLSNSRLGNLNTAKRMIRLCRKGVLDYGSVLAEEMGNDELRIFCHYLDQIEEEIKART